MFPYQHIIHIQQSSKTPVYQQIASSIIDAITQGTLQAGTRLPSSRALAKTLGVHRKTVIAAYAELDAQAWVVVAPRKFIAIAQQIPALQPQQWNATGNAVAAYANDFRLPFKNIVPQTTASAGTAFTELVIDDGHPDVRLSPIDELLKTYRSLTARKYGIKNANLGTTQGTLQLREALVSYLSETRGLNITANHLLITHGAQMSIYLAAQLLLGPGATVIVGNPNYPVANAAFEQTGANLIQVAVDENGIDTDAIAQICKAQSIQAVYVIPHHHYPTTVTLSVPRRLQLLALAKEFSFAIIEDDYDYDYHYTAYPYLPLASANHNGQVIYMGSFSKILDPSLRIGFMVAPQNFIAQCTAYRKLIDFGGDGYMQNALALLIQTGELKRHLKKAKKCYHQRRDFLDKLLQEKLGDHMTYTLPAGGMAIWVYLNKQFPINKLVTAANIQITRTDPTLNAFRFGFASANEQELLDMVETLQQVLTGAQT